VIHPKTVKGGVGLEFNERCNNEINKLNELPAQGIIYRQM